MNTTITTLIRQVKDAAATGNYNLASSAANTLSRELFRLALTTEITEEQNETNTE